jgi:hypothetical protein
MLRYFAWGYFYDLLLKCFTLVLGRRTMELRC